MTSGRTKVAAGASPLTRLRSTLTALHDRFFPWGWEDQNGWHEGEPTLERARGMNRKINGDRFVQERLNTTKSD